MGDHCGAEEAQSQDGAERLTGRGGDAEARGRAWKVREGSAKEMSGESRDTDGARGGDWNNGRGRTLEHPYSLLGLARNEKV